MCVGRKKNQRVGSPLLAELSSGQPGRLLGSLRKKYIPHTDVLLHWCAKKDIAFSFDTLYQRATLSSSGPIKRSGDLFLSIVITGEEGEEGPFCCPKDAKKDISHFYDDLPPKEEGRDRTTAALLFHFKTEGERAEEEEEEDLFLFFSFFSR